jgi:hypothetical protein
MTDRPLGLGELRGCQDHDCERHRPLAGPHQLKLVKILISSAISMLFGGAGAGVWPWPVVPTQAARDIGLGGNPLNRYDVSAPKNYMTVFVDGIDGVDDPIIYQVPWWFEDAHWLTRWTMTVTRSGAVTIHGDRAIFWRSVWWHLGACQDAVVMRYGGAASLPDRDQRSVYFTITSSEAEWSTANSSGAVRWATDPATWGVEIHSRTDVRLTGELPPASAAFWGQLASVLPSCPPVRH